MLVTIRDPTTHRCSYWSIKPVIKIKSTRKGAPSLKIHTSRTQEGVFFYHESTQESTRRTCRRMDISFLSDTKRRRTKTYYLTVWFWLDKLFIKKNNDLDGLWVPNRDIKYYHKRESERRFKKFYIFQNRPRRSRLNFRLRIKKIDRATQRV